MSLVKKRTADTMQFESMMVLNPDLLRERIGQETLVVCGAPRGGTSIVAYSLYQFGYFIGDDLGRENHEDNEFLNALPGNKFAFNYPGKKSKYLDLVEKRNEAHERWGFKLPHAALYIPELMETLRNPVFVVCVRNPLAIARSIMTREGNFKGTLTDALDVARRYLEPVDYLAARTDVPTILVDIDGVKKRPGVFLQNFCAQLGLKGDMTPVVQEILKPGYKTVTPKTQAQ